MHSAVKHIPLTVIKCFWQWVHIQVNFISLLALIRTFKQTTLGNHLAMDEACNWLSLEREVPVRTGQLNVDRERRTEQNRTANCRQKKKNMVKMDRQKGKKIVDRREKVIIGLLSTDRIEQGRNGQLTHDTEWRNWYKLAGDCRQRERKKNGYYSFSLRDVKM